jgi:hypothetical protein
MPRPAAVVLLDHRDVDGRGTSRRTERGHGVGHQLRARTGELAQVLADGTHERPNGVGCDAAARRTKLPGDEVVLVRIRLHRGARVDDGLGRLGRVDQRLAPAAAPMPQDNDDVRLGRCEQRPGVGDQLISGVV